MKDEESEGCFGRGCGWMVWGYLLSCVAGVLCMAAGNGWMFALGLMADIVALLMFCFGIHINTKK